MNRREFVKSSALAAGTLTIGAHHASAKQDDTEPEKPFVPNRIACSTYSFWRYRDDSKFTMTKCIDLISEMGFDGVELLEVQMEKKSDDYLRQLKRQALVNGLDLVGISTHQDFVDPDPEVRKKNVEKTNASIELAYKAGNSKRFG